MTTDKLPKVEQSSKNDNGDSAAPAVHSSAEKAIKQSAIDIESKGGRRIKFIPNSRSAKASFVIAGTVGVLLLLLVVVMIFGGGNPKKTTVNSGSNPVVLKNLDTDNNSSGYTQSPTASFGTYSLDLEKSQPAIIKSTSLEGKIGEQLTWDDGFVIMATSVDRDFRPASEFTYKKIAEAGDELVRVNILVGNASPLNMDIGYKDLALYAAGEEMENTESERISEDTYSPRDGQILGSKQTQKISLHFRVKRDKQFTITKTKTFTQNNAKVKAGEEKNPVLKLKINLV